MGGEGGTGQLLGHRQDKADVINSQIVKRENVNGRKCRSSVSIMAFTQSLSVSNNPKTPTCYYIPAMITLTSRYEIRRMLFAGCSFVFEIFCPHLGHQLGWQLCCQQLEKGLASEGGGVDHWAISNAEISIVSRIQHTKIYSNKY